MSTQDRNQETARTVADVCEIMFSPVEVIEPRCLCFAEYLGHSAHTTGCPLDNTPR